MNKDQESEMRLIKEKCTEEKSLPFHPQKSTLIEFALCLQFKILNKYNLTEIANYVNA